MKSLKISGLSILFALAAFAQKETLLIGPGDTLHVEVYDTPEMEQHPRVTDAGDIPLMFIGRVKVGAMTPADAAKAIEAALLEQHFMLHPQVSVTVESFATQDVSVMGEVNDPGTYDLQTATPILRILSLAGGITGLANRNITIERHAHPGEKVNYYLSNQSDEAISSQVMVYPGDTVLVPRVGVVYVMGDVGKPGGYPMSTNDSQMTVLQALALAGTLNKTAMLSKARLVRKTPAGLQDIPIELAEMQKGKKPDVAVEPNDVIYVPFSWMKNMALATASIGNSASTALIYAHP